MGNQGSLFSWKPKVEVPSPNPVFVTGVDVEEQNFPWTIENWNLVRMNEQLINSQRIDFWVKEATGHRTKWWARLVGCGNSRGNRWIYIYLSSVKSGPTDPTVYAKFRFAIKNKEGEVIKQKDTWLMCIEANSYERAILFAFLPTEQSIDPDDDDLCPEEDLVIHIMVKVYTLSQPRLISSLEDIQEKFQVRFFEQLEKDLGGVLKSPDASADIKIVANDGGEFTLQKEVLEVRSDVFAAMLNSDMIEGNSGVVKLPDISSNGLQVLLDFLATGKLLPEWRNAEVLPELTNAAAKYQLQNLLQFLDLTIGKVCTVENTKPLLTFARQLPLKVAEKELMTFLRKGGVRSADNCIQMCNYSEG